MAISELSQFLDDNAHKVCALIVKPLIQGAAGMKMHRAEDHTIVRTNETIHDVQAEDEIGHVVDTRKLI